MSGESPQQSADESRDAIPSSALEDLGPGGPERLRRTILFAATGTGTLLSAVFWVFGAMKDIDSVERVIVPVLAVMFAALTLLTWKGRLRGAELGLFLVGGGVLLERIHFSATNGKPGLIPVLDTYELLIWFPCLYLFAFLVFDRRRALMLSLTLLLASAALVWRWVVPGASTIYHGDVSEFFMGQLGCLMLVYGFARLKMTFLDTHKLAVNLRSFAETDFLTGIANRRSITLALEQEILQCERVGGSLAVILLDLDEFKGVNDTHGHDEGDRVLRRVAMLMDRSRRQTDVFGRWGGEEFLLVAPNLDLPGAFNAAERLRDLIETSGQGTRAAVTASFGVADYRPGDTVSGLVKRADQALMEAKQGGRNRVVAGAA